MKFYRSKWGKVPPILTAAIISVAVIPSIQLLWKSIFVESATDWPLIVNAMILILLAIILYIIVHIAQKLEVIHDHSQLQVRFLPCNDTSSIQETYKTVKKIVENCPDNENTHIMALNSFLEAIQEPVDPGNLSRLEYYDALINKKTTYTRILQTHEQFGSNLASKMQGGYYEHYKKMIEKSNSLPTTKYRMNVFKAHATYPFSFLLIDVHDGESNLFWQIDNHLNGSGEKFMVAGYLMISDPNRIITNEFRSFFENVRNATGTIKLEMDDIQETK